MILVRKVDTWLERCQSVVEEIQEKSEFFSDLILHKQNQKPFLTGPLFEKSKTFWNLFCAKSSCQEKGEGHVPEKIVLEKKSRSF